MATYGDMPRIDFSPIGQLGDVYGQAKLKANRERTLAELAQGAPIGTVANKLFSVGDVEGGLSLARLADAQALREYNIKRDERDFGFRQSQAGEERRRWEAERSDPRLIGTPETGVYAVPRSGGATPPGFAPGAGPQQPGGLTQILPPQQDKPQLKTIKDAAGNESLVYVRPDGRVTTLDTGEKGATNPFSTGGKMTEAQGKDALYAGRMMQSEKILRDVEMIGTDFGERARGMVSDRVGYNVRGKDYQKFDQAQRDFINATLRRESGAVISPSEFDNANKQYFPMPGDTKEVIAQKRANRAEAIRGIAGSAGPAWQPPFTFGQNNELVPTKGPRPGETTKPQMPQNDRPEIVEARTLIAQGKDRAKVEAILRRNRIPYDPRDLDLQ